jgi:hypothetical protein
MFTVERVYGAAHFVQYFSGAGREVVPSRGLVQELQTLPSGTRIGIEEFDPQETPNQLKGINIQVGDENIEIDGGLYWSNLTAICQNLDLEMVYLDDPLVFERYTEKLASVISVRRQLKSYENSLDARQLSLLTENTLRDFREASYKAETEGEYINAVEREEAMMKRIVKYQPQRVIVGSGHAFYWAADPSYTIQRGFEVASFKADYLPDMEHYQSQVHAVLSSKLPPTGSSRVLSERRSLQRRYQAVTTNRIFPAAEDEYTDYIGTWSVENRMRGLFEMCVYGQKNGVAHGVINDTKGEARFRGKITEDEIEIVKTYLEGGCTEDAIMEPITFKGQKDKNGLYIGTFNTELGHEGRFVMNEGTKVLF